MGLFSKKDKKKDEGGPAPFVPSVVAQKDPYAIDQGKYAHYGGKPSAYEQAKAAAAPPGSAAAQQRQQGFGGPPSAAASARAPSYGGSSMRGSPPPAYGADRYSNAPSTYGGSQGQRQQNPYGGASQAGPSRGAGGYGGLGRVNSNDTLSTQAGKDALFGDARERAQKKETEQNNGFPGDNKQPSGEYYATGTPAAGPSYGAYQDRNLTAEEEEEEDVQATKQQIRFMKKEDVNSTRNALRIAAQAEETGRGTLARLGAQGERIHNTERNLDLAANHNRLAEEKARELKTLNGSMFAVHISNPFTSASRKAQRDADILEKHRMERAEREISQREAFGSNQRMEKNFKELGSVQPTDPGFTGYRSKVPTKASLAERAKYQFEADSEDDEMENELDANLHMLHGAAGRLRKLADATGEEVDSQNRHIERIAGKTEKVDDAVVMNKARLDRIH